MTNKNLLLLLFFSFVVNIQCEFFYETDTRIIIVAGENPEDGHLRLFRSANARHLEPVMLRVKREDSEMERIRHHLNGLSSDPNEISVITPSKDYLVTNHAARLALNVGRVALTRDGDVVMAYPMNRTLSSFSTSVDDEVELLMDQLEELNAIHDRGPNPTPYTLEDWKMFVRLNKELNRLLVLQKQLQAKKASIYDERYCAFAGLTEALKVLFTKMETHPDLSGISSVSELCTTLAGSAPLLQELKVVKDLEGYVFKRSPVSLEDVLLVKDAISKGPADMLHSSSYNFAPFTFGPPELLPFLLANFASGDLILPAPPREDFLDDFIEDLDEHYQNGLPDIHIVAVTTDATNDLTDFCKHISRLTYPKNKINLDMLIQEENKEALQNFLETVRNFEKENSGLFQSLKGVSIETVDVRAVYAKAWQIMKEGNGNYSFLLHTSVILTDPYLIEDLLMQNRRVVSPLLRNKELTATNFKAERNGNILLENMMTELYVNQFEETKPGGIFMTGLLQVPYVFGAIFLRQEVVQEVELNFNLCPMVCVEEEEAFDCLKKKREEDSCESNYYENLDGRDEMIWGMMCKNIMEQGNIIYVTNENVYGIVDISREVNEEKSPAEDSEPAKKEGESEDESKDANEKKEKKETEKEEKKGVIDKGEEVKKEETEEKAKQNKQ